MTYLVVPAQSADLLEAYNVGNAAKTAVVFPVLKGM